MAENRKNVENCIVPLNSGKLYLDKVSHIATVDMLG